MHVKLIVGALLSLLLVYGAIKAWPLLTGPSLVLDIPANYTTFPDGVVRVSGIARHTESLFLNNGPLYIDPEGRFETELSLPQGGAILTLTATDRFGRTVTKQRTVYIP